MARIAACHDGAVSTAAEDGSAVGVKVLQPEGLGVAPKPPLDPFGVWRRRCRQYRTAGRQWFSPLAFYLGPFDEQYGLEGSVDFFRRSSLHGKPPQVYLTATENAVGIIPTQNWMMRKGRGTAGAIWLPYDNVTKVQLEPATKARMAIMLPNTAYQLGQVLLTTNDDRRAKLSGTPVAELSEFLASLGATIVG